MLRRSEAGSHLNPNLTGGILPHARHEKNLLTVLRCGSALFHFDARQTNLNDAGLVDPRNADIFEGSGIQFARLNILETCFVPTIKRLRIQVGIGAEQDRPPLGMGIHDEHDTQNLPRT